MPRASIKPYIFLAWAHTTPDSVLSKRAIAESNVISEVLSPFVEQGGCEVLHAQPGSRLYAEDVFSRKPIKQEIAIVHVIGERPSGGNIEFSGRSGIKTMTFSHFSETLSSFPQLQLVVLSGMGDGALIHEILSKGIPAVISFEEGDSQIEKSELFYDILLQGRNIRKAVEELGENTGQALDVHKATWDHKAESLMWESSEAWQTSPLGLYVRTEKIRNLNWRLRNPLLIPLKDSVDRRKARQKKKGGTTTPMIGTAIKEKPAIDRRKPPVKNPNGRSTPPPAKEKPPVARKELNKEQTVNKTNANQIVKTPVPPVVKQEPVKEQSTPKGEPKKVEAKQTTPLTTKEPVKEQPITKADPQKTDTKQTDKKVVPPVAKREPIKEQPAAKVEAKKPENKQPVNKSVPPVAKKESVKEQPAAKVEAKKPETKQPANKSVPPTTKKEPVKEQPAAKVEAKKPETKQPANKSVPPTTKKEPVKEQPAAKVEAKKPETKQPANKSVPPLAKKEPVKEQPTAKVEAKKPETKQPANKSVPPVVKKEPVKEQPAAKVESKKPETKTSPKKVLPPEKKKETVKETPATKVESKKVDSKQIASPPKAKKETVKKEAPNKIEPQKNTSEKKTKTPPPPKAKKEPIKEKPVAKKEEKKADPKKSAKSEVPPISKHDGKKEQPTTQKEAAKESPVIEKSNDPKGLKTKIRIKKRGDASAADADSKGIGLNKLLTPEIGEKRGKPATRPEKRKRPERQRPNKQEANQIKPPVKKRDHTTTGVSRSKLLRTGGIIGGLIGIVAIVWFGLPALMGLFSANKPTANSCPFPQEDGNYHVLVLPFQHAPDCEPTNVAYENILLKRLADMKKTEKVSVEGRFFMLEDCNELEEKARSLASTCYSDLVVWGTTEEKNGTEMLNINIFSTNKHGENMLLNNQVMTRSIPLDQVNTASSDFAAELDGMVYWALAIRNFNNENHPASIKYLNWINPWNKEISAAVNLLLTQCYTRTGQYEKAKANYNKIIEEDPSNTKAYYERGKIFGQMGEYPDALADFNTVLGREPDDINVLISRGVLQTERGNYKSALSDFNRVLRLNPEFSPVYCSRAKVYELTNRNANAIRDYSTAIQISPEYVEAYYLRAKLQQKLGRERDARRDIEKALEINPSYTDAMLFTGDVHVQKAEYDRALDAYSQLLDTKKSPEVYFKRGQVYKLVKEYQSAIKDFSQAIEMNENMD